MASCNRNQRRASETVPSSISSPRIELADGFAHEEDAKALFAEYTAFLLSLDEGNRLYLMLQHYDEELADLRASTDSFFLPQSMARPLHAQPCAFSLPSVVS